MKLLLDTCTFIWFNAAERKLSDRAFSLITDPNNEVYLSAVSGWEMTVKYLIGRLILPEAPSILIPRTREHAGIRELVFSEREAFHLSKLPAIHNDPFDRMLVCQALLNGMSIVTPDPDIQKYPVETLW